ncbi:calcium-binding protein [Nonomuraea sp. NEAU-A123]|uniref:calcium-binding protein n=1 Tax=Nonomuraea sp. NEAU-A123 TaxID=2839649 RepID=UPI001BE44B89|nr:hypothetical protein [Nonomuraea sp. NEAU-A123]MBT2232432.1 hypothetical protein [Nonomuraea sp. NEAU-A123]
MTRTIRRFGHSAVIAGASLVLMSSPGLLAQSALAATPPPIMEDCFGAPISTFVVPLFVPPGGAAFVGTSRADLIIGTDGPDRIFGDAGNDRICGGDGEDYIEGGRGDDLVHGEGHRREIHGGEGNDTVYGGLNPPGGFHEALYGEEGADYLIGGTGPDILVCATFPDLPQVGDFVDGGTGMGNGAPEDDSFLPSSGCDSAANIP